MTEGPVALIGAAAVTGVLAVVAVIIRRRPVKRARLSAIESMAASAARIADASSRQVKTLIEEIETMRASSMERSAQIAALTHDVERLKRRLEAMKQQLEKCTNDHEQARRENAALRTQLQESQDKIATMEREIARLKSLSSRPEKR